VDFVPRRLGHVLALRSRFDLDEAALQTGAELLARLAIDALYQLDDR
jgi:hypothetical protein